MSTSGQGARTVENVRHTAKYGGRFPAEHRHAFALLAVMFATSETGGTRGDERVMAQSSRGAENGRFCDAARELFLRAIRLVYFSVDLGPSHNAILDALQTFVWYSAKVSSDEVTGGRSKILVAFANVEPLPRHARACAKLRGTPYERT